MQNWDETLLSQYANSPTITGLLQSLNAAIDPAVDLQNLYTNRIALDTAVGEGLDNWGQLVGVSRYMQVTETGPFLGFAEAYVVGDDLDSFGNAPMYPGQMWTNTIALADDAFRQIIMIKAAANISDLTAGSLNSLLNLALGLTKTGTNRVFVQDTGDMSQRFVMEFTPSSYQISIMVSSGIIPRSTGVKAWIYIIPPPTFGFAEAASGTPFGVGTFLSPAGVQNAS